MTYVAYRFFAHLKFLVFNSLFSDRTMEMELAANYNRSLPNGLAVGWTAFWQNFHSWEYGFQVFLSSLVKVSHILGYAH